MQGQRYEVGNRWMVLAFIVYDLVGVRELEINNNCNSALQLRLILDISSAVLTYWSAFEMLNAIKERFES